jgi:hypothetical protein
MLIVPDSSTKWTQCFTREISDRVTFRNDAAGIDKDYFIEGIKHDWVFYGTQSFSTQYQLSDATTYDYPADAVNETLRPDSAGTTTQLSPIVESNIVNETLRPNATGTYSEHSLGAPNTGESNYQDVDEEVADEDTTYIKNVSGDTKRDLYNIPSSAYATGNIISVTVYVRARKVEGVGSPTVGGYIKTGGNAYGTASHSITGGYETISDAWTTNPQTGVAWTVSDINALEVGVISTAATAWGQILYITQVYVVVRITPTTTGSSNWLMVSDINTDEDTTYNRATGGAGALYDLYNLPTSGYGTGTINSVTVYARVRKETGSSGVGNARLACRTESTTYYGDNEALGESYAEISKEYTTNPNTSIAWTWTQINALQIGIELPSASGTAVYGRCTQAYAIVNFTP